MTPPSTVSLAPEPAAIVVVAGLPGAGKTTLVASEPRALDSDALREAWAPRLAGLPYALWRPLVHAWHWIAIWRALKRPEGVIVVRPFTAGWSRRAVLSRARGHHPAVHLVVVEATPAQARAGQRGRGRGRTVRERAMRRHERRWARADFAHEQWTTVTRVPRSALGQPIAARRSPGCRRAPGGPGELRLGKEARGPAQLAGAAAAAGRAAETR